MTTLEIAAPEFVRRFQSGEIPTTARVTVVYEDRETRDPMLALIQSWLDQAPTEAGEIEEAKADWQEVQDGLNQNRKVAGSRLLFPEETAP